MLPITAWTDYPINELGDIPYKEAPIRQCEIIDYDGDKYATVIVEGVEVSFKVGYLYKQPGRCGEVAKVCLKKRFEIIVNPIYPYMRELAQQRLHNMKLRNQF